MHMYSMLENTILNYSVIYRLARRRNPNNYLLRTKPIAGCALLRRFPIFAVEKILIGL